MSDLARQVNSSCREPETGFDGLVLKSFSNRFLSSYAARSASYRAIRCSLSTYSV
ncbi:MAG TPA: hypothetical protein VHI50_06460 [Micromonosporaceae bacterium]|nr:hypothetical protein [Micromonosporaceae bacterium]